MSQSNTTIKFKRTQSLRTDSLGQTLNFGEPFFVDNTQTVTDPSDKKCNAYLFVGRKAIEGESQETDVIASNSPVFKALDLENADNLVFYNSTNGSITNESGVEIPTNKVSVDTIDTLSSSGNRYYILTQAYDDGDHTDKRVSRFKLENAGIYVTDNGVMCGAAWNDYAENRQVVGAAKPGQVLCEIGDGRVSISNERLQPCPYVFSDTYGYVLNADEDLSIPVAVAGRALVYVNGNPKLGDCVCADKDGFASIMSRQEIANYPDRILGIVSELPTYSSWNGIEVDGRVWIKVK